MKEAYRCLDGCSGVGHHFLVNIQTSHQGWRTAWMAGSRSRYIHISDQKSERLMPYLALAHYADPSDYSGRDVESRSPQSSSSCHLDHADCVKFPLFYSVRPVRGRNLRDNEHGLAYNLLYFILMINTVPASTQPY